MTAHSKGRRPRPPLTESALQDMAIRYVGRFATTRAKLRSYLTRKLRERGWDGANEPDVERIAERMAELGYVNDQAFALAKAQSLTGRGFGKRRVDEKLRQAGVAEEDGEQARAVAEEGALASALRYAERRRFGPYSVSTSADPRQREKAIGAMVRAGHAFGLARRIVDLPAGSDVNVLYDS
jgi:regulatory protein